MCFCFYVVPHQYLQWLLHHAHPLDRPAVRGRWHACQLTYYRFHAYDLRAHLSQKRGCIGQINSATFPIKSLVLIQIFLSNHGLYMIICILLFKLTKNLISKLNYRSLLETRKFLWIPSMNHMLLQHRSCSNLCKDLSSDFSIFFTKKVYTRGTSHSLPR